MTTTTKTAETTIKEDIFKSFKETEMWQEFCDEAKDLDYVGEGEAYQTYEDYFWDSDWGEEQLSEFRYNWTHETGIPCEVSRHYESKSVAAQLKDGTWVGWIYWYGGGKHGEPGAVKWLEDAYFLEMKEETQVVKVFTKKEADNDS